MIEVTGGGHLTQNQELLTQCKTHFDIRIFSSDVFYMPEISGLY